MPSITVFTFDINGQKAAEVRADEGVPFRIGVGGTMIEVIERKPAVTVAPPAAPAPTKRNGR